MSCSPSHILDVGGDPMERLIRELDDTCGMCEGEGTVRNPDFDKFHEEHKGCTFVHMGNPCGDRGDQAHIEYCMSHNYVSAPAQEITCAGCRGKGAVPTDVGMAILRFIQRHS